MQQASGYGNALPLTAGERASVFSARGIGAPGSKKGFQPGAADGKRCFFFGEITEHGDIIQDGAVKEKYVLLYDGNKVIQGIRPEGAQLPAVIQDLPLIACIASLKELQQG